MLRNTSFAVLVTGLLSLGAYQSGNPKFADRPFPVNSSVARFFLDDARPAPEETAASELAEADSVSSDLHILMLNYTAYDSMYVAKVRHLISKRLPGVTLTDFWDGSAEELDNALQGHQIVVITYPAGGSKSKVKAYGKALAQFVRQGGAVVFSGTDIFGTLQQYGLLEVDFGYYCKDLDIQETDPGHPVLRGVPSQFSMANYAYPLDISDPAFITLADVSDCPTLGYKPLGAGKVVYLGLEYYFDESASTRILENTLRWLAPPSRRNTALSTRGPADTPLLSPGALKHSEETLYAGSGRSQAAAAAFEIKIFPNPYFDKATLDLNLQRPEPVTVEMTDETGVIVAVLLPSRLLNAGLYRLDVPNLPTGVYFVKCQIGNQSTVRKVVKVSAQ
ncbi:MAG: T9SS type A sorting domain-containing protein [Saprospiraceae bacterium]|nr:T9SS type A sorting domain-containing protein [Saprospiraceae bacterium]